MAEKFLSGNAGQCLIGSANEHPVHFNTWSATFSRAMHDVTAFGDTGRRRIPGIADVTGSAGGFMTYDASDTNPGVFQDAHGSADSDAMGHAIVLTVGGDSGNCHYDFHGLVSDVAINTAMGGDATITMNFALSSGLQYAGNSGTTAMEAWDES